MTGNPPRIRGYQFVKFLGAGGFGEVYQYTREASGASVAIKVLRVDKLGRDAAAQVLREAQALGRLADIGNHANIVTVQDVDATEDGRPYLAMEYCPGGNWAQYIEKEGRVAPSEVLKVGIQIAGALYTAHQRGVVHRDVKPGNILLGRQNVPKLADLGIAALTPEEVRHGSQWLSRDYAALEVVESTVGDELSDLFALAATLYHALSGRSWVREPGGDNSPEALNARIAAGRIPEIAGNEIPERLKRLIIQAMDPSPKERARYMGVVGHTEDQRKEALKRFALHLRDIQEEASYPPTPLPIDDVEVPAQPPTVHPLPPIPATGPREASLNSDLLMWDLPKGGTEPAARRGFAVGRSPVAGRDPEVTAPFDEQPEPAPRRIARKTWLIAAGVVLAAGIVVALNLAMPISSPEAVESGRPAGDSAVPDRMALPVPVVTATREEGGSVVFRWTYTNPVSGDRFTVQRSGRPTSELSDRPEWTVTEPAGTEVCLRVSVIRDNQVGLPSAQVCA